MSECSSQYSQTYFFIYTPVSSPQEQCAWCWPYLHPDRCYPEHWSSTICAQHSLQVIEQRYRRNRMKRYTALLTVYTHLTHRSLPYYQYDKKQWQQKIQQLFRPERDSSSSLQIIYTAARQRGRQDYRRYSVKHSGQHEPFSLVWERGTIAAGRFFRQPPTTVEDTKAHRDTFTYWYCIGYMQQAFLMSAGHKDDHAPPTYQILIGPARNARAVPYTKLAATDADEYCSSMVIPVQNQLHPLSEAL